MVRKNELYRILGVVAFGLTVLAMLVVLTGTAEPYVSPAQFPGEHLGVVGGGIVVILLVGGIFGYLPRRAWKRAGRQAGLSPESGGLLGGKPDFAGRIRGRPVRARTYTRKSGSGGEGGTRRSQTYTVVETELTRPLDDGFIIQQKSTMSNSIQFNLFPGSTKSVGDDAEFEVLGGPSEAFASEILSGPSGEALEDLQYVKSISVGNTRQVTMDAIPDSLQSLAGMTSSADGGSGEDLDSQAAASGVVHKTKGLLVDAAELERQIEAVVAVAESVDSNRGGPESGAE